MVDWYDTGMTPRAGMGALVCNERMQWNAKVKVTDMATGTDTHSSSQLLAMKTLEKRCYRLRQFSVNGLSKESSRKKEYSWAYHLEEKKTFIES